MTSIDEKIDKYLNEGLGVSIKKEDGYVCAYKGKKMVAKAKYPVSPGDDIKILDKSLKDRVKNKVIEKMSNFK